MCSCGKASHANWLAGLDRGLLVVDNVSDTSSLAVHSLSTYQLSTL